MGVVRIHAIGPGAVEYLLHGCDPVHPEPGQELELEPGQEPGGEGIGQEQAREHGVGYFLESHGEPVGRWLGSGMEGLGLSIRAGDQAKETELRALFGELRYPSSQHQNSTAEHPIYLGSKPRAYQTLAERVEAALKAEPDAPEGRQREIRLQTARNTKSNTAYYDVTFSPDKSVSVYYAALLAAGETDLAQAVREAHDQAIRIAVDSAEVDVAWAKTGRHGRASEQSGRTTGEWQQATGLSAVLFAHHTNRDGEPQLHAHVAVLNRVALEDGRVFALDGQAFRPVKDAMTAAYDRAFEAILTELTGVAFVSRVDGKGRAIAGIDPELVEEASTRTRAHVEPRIGELVAAYQQRHGYEPGPQARRAIVDQAVKDTRRPKAGPAGPAAVAAWIDRVAGRRGRLEDTLDAVDEAVAMAAARGRPEPMATGYVRGQEMATGHERMATPGHVLADGQAAMAGPGEVATAGPGAAARAELGARAVAAGLDEVQALYPSWTVGSLVAAIDRHLGDDVNAVGLGLHERRAWVRGLAEQALDPASGAGVVRVSMGDPVPVPDELRRESDGRSRFRAHIDERYTTAEHLSVEQRLVERAQAGGTRSLDVDTVARLAGDAQRAGLSPDQVTAVATILGSDRRVEVLVGPAGAGKSHTLSVLSREWVAEHRGRVIGTATAEIAARNLAGLGMDAVNTRALLTALEPDDHGRVRMRLTDRDLLVVDEAGMASTADLDRLVGYAAAAGAKMVWSGDHHQLASVEAGGMFAYLAERPGAIELETVHRFRSQWERDASLRLREGDTDVAAVYADHGRLRTGSVEQMEYMAGRDYLADRIEGVSSLLIVGTNAHAAQLSDDIQQQLVELGLVDPAVLAELPNQSRLHRGDLIQARANDRSLRVDPGVDEHGQRREALPVTNRELYTVVGRDPRSGYLLARDERGAIAHLPPWYVKQHVSLAYAVTNHAAQGVTVERGRAIADRDMTLEALYPASTRGRESNVIYLVTEVEPDDHDPQRVRDTAEGRMVQLLERSDDTSDAALTVLEAAQLESRSMLTLAEHYDRVAAERGHTRHAALVVEHLSDQFGDELGAHVGSEDAFGALLGRLRAAELEGHDVAAVVAAAVDMGRFSDAESVSKVLHWRVGRLTAEREPEHSREQVQDGRRSLRPAWEQLAEQHHTRAAETGDQVEAMLGALAARAHERTDELGADMAADPPRWATAWLGPVPDPANQPEAHRDWTRGAGQVAAYREYRGIPDDETSIGAAPPPSQQLAHELWARAVEVGAGDPQTVDWRKASDHDLREAVARWDRAQQWAPMEVSAERGDALALAHDARNDATLGRAQLAVMGPDDPGRERLEVRVEADEVMAEQAEGFAASLDDGYASYNAWWNQTRDRREAAAGASAELARRGLNRHDEPEPELDRDHQSGPSQTEPRTAEDQPQLERDAPEQGRVAGQQAFDLEIDSPEIATPEIATPEMVSPEVAHGAEPGQVSGQAQADLVEQRHQRFVDGLAAEHRRALDEVDPDRRLSPQAREAAVRQQSYDRFTRELRDQHGARLDPDGQLSDLDLAHRRAVELAAQTAAPGTREHGVDQHADHTPPEPERSDGNRGTVEPPMPTIDEQRTHRDQAARGREPVAEPDGVEHTPSSREDLAASAAALARAAREDRAARITRETRDQLERDTGREATPQGAPQAQQGERQPSQTVADLDRDLAETEQLEAGRAPSQAEQARERDRQREIERTHDTGLERD